MKTQKTTPKQRKEIAARAASGEKQVHLAKEFGVSEGLISRIVKQAGGAAGVATPVQPRDFSSRTTDQLQNRFRAAHEEIKRHYTELSDSAFEAKHLRRCIDSETEKLNGVEDEVYRAALTETIRAYQKQLVYHTDTKRVCFALKVLYAEVSAILHELEKREDGDIPVIKFSL